MAVPPVTSCPAETVRGRNSRGSRFSAGRREPRATARARIAAPPSSSGSRWMSARVAGLNGGSVTGTPSSASADAVRKSDASSPEIQIASQSRQSSRRRVTATSPASSSASLAGTVRLSWSRP